jgi:DHA1 family tetracycline resistance protein-like MFS transporter
MSEKKKLNPILAVFITVFIDMLGVGIIIPVFAPLIIRNTHGMMPLDTPEATRNLIYGILAATFAFAQFFGAPILGTLADKKGRKSILQVSIAGTCFGYILFALAIHYKLLWLLFIARAIPGFMGGNIAIVLASLADISEPKDRAKNFGLIGMSFGLGFILGPAIGGLLAQPTALFPWFDYATPLWFTALLSAVNFYYVQTQFPETFKPSGVGEVSLLMGIRNIKKAFALINMRVILLTLFLQAVGFSFFMQFFQVYLIKKFDFTTSEIGLVFGYIGIWIAFTQGVLTRVISAKFMPPQILRISLIVLSSALILIILPAKWQWLLVIQPLVAMAQGLSQPNLTSLVSQLTPKENQGEILGIQQSVQSIAFGVPPLIAGVIVSIDVRFPIMAASFITLLAWAVFYFGFNKKEQPLKQDINS